MTTSLHGVTSQSAKIWFTARWKLEITPHYRLSALGNVISSYCVGKLNVCVRTFLKFISDITCYFNEYEITIVIEQLTVICLASPNTIEYNKLFSKFLHAGETRFASKCSSG